MLAYVKLVQSREKELGCDVLTHQKWSGAGYIDGILGAIQSGSSGSKSMGEGNTETGMLEDRRRMGPTNSFKVFRYKSHCNTKSSNPNTSSTCTSFRLITADVQAVADPAIFRQCEPSYTLPPPLL